MLLLSRELRVAVSVARASDGTPVSGLGIPNFRLASSFGDVFDFDFLIDRVREWNWQRSGERHRERLVPAGCYQVSIVLRPRILVPADPFKVAVFAIQVRTFDNHTPPHVVDQGQTLVKLGQ